MLLHILSDMQKQLSWKIQIMIKKKIAQIMGHASVRSQQSYGRKKKKSKGGFNDIEDIKTNIKPRGADRLLRFKIASKNQAAAKIADTSTPSSPPPAPVRRFKMWTVSSSGGPLLDCEGLAWRRAGFLANPPYCEAGPGTGQLDGFPCGGLICYLKTNDLKNHLKSWKFHPLSVLKILRCS